MTDRIQRMRAWARGKAKWKTYEAWGRALMLISGGVLIFAGFAAFSMREHGTYAAPIIAKYVENRGGFLSSGTDYYHVVVNATGNGYTDFTVPGWRYQILNVGDLFLWDTDAMVAPESATSTLFAGFLFAYIPLALWKGSL